MLPNSITNLTENSTFLNSISPRNSFNLIDPLRFTSDFRSIISNKFLEAESALAISATTADSFPEFPKTFQSNTS